MRKLRQFHFYLGIFFAPLIFFFALSGTLQVFKLHESYRAVPGQQGDWVAWFGSFHKEQAWIEPRVAKPRPDGAPPPKKDNGWDKPMKWLVALCGVSLMASTLLGLFIAYTLPGRRKALWLTLAAGVLVPLALMAT